MYIKRKISSFLEEEKQFAKKDYEGLDDIQKEVLKKKRSEYAKELRKSRNNTGVKGIKDLLEKNGWDSVETNSTIKGGGVVSKINVVNNANQLDNYDTLAKRHVKNIREEQLRSARDAGRIMRDQVINDLDGEVAKIRESKNNQSTKGINGELVNSDKSKARINKEKLSKRVVDWAKRNKKGLTVATLASLGTGAAAIAYNKNRKRNKEE